MGPIKDVSGLPFDLKKIKREDELKRVRSSKESKEKDVKGKSVSKGGDTVEISTIGKDLLKQKKEVSQYLENIKNSETSNQKDLYKIGQRISDNYYSKPEVLEKIVDSILALPSFRTELPTNPEKVTNTSESNENPAKAAKRGERLDEIRSNIQDGNYDSDAVINVIVEELLKSGQF